MGKVDLKKAGWLNVAVVAANTENLNTKLESDLRAYRARYSTKIGRTSRINFWGRYEEIENQDAFVDLVAMNGLDSPYQTGYGAAPFTFYTFQDWRQSLGEDVVFNSYNRLSAYNRKIGRVGANWIWRPVRRGSLKVGYQYKSIDRDNVVLADGTGKSTSNQIKLAWNQRFRKRTRINAKLSYTDTDNPYVNDRGARRTFAFDAANYDPANPITAVLGVAPSPLTPQSLQYYQLHVLRMADVSNAATSQLKFLANASYAPKGAKWSLTGTLRLRAAENDELNETEWTQGVAGVGVTAWVAPSPRFYLTAVVDLHRAETETEVIIPLMDG
jgi:hypothetical protein